jgi:hypothetical protein
MTITDLMQVINDSVRGTDDDVPTEGTDDWSYWLRVVNQKRDELYRDSRLKLASAYVVLNLGTVTASAAPVYNLATTFKDPAASPYVITTAGGRKDLDYTKPEEQNYTTQAVFVAGSNPHKLYFTQEITSDSDLVGGELYQPAWIIPAAYTAGSDTVIDDDPYWLALAASADIAGNDLTYEDKEPNLTAKANNRYEILAATNRSGSFGNPRVTPTNTRTRLGGRL